MTICLCKFTAHDLFVHCLFLLQHTLGLNIINKIGIYMRILNIHKPWTLAKWSSGILLFFQGNDRSRYFILINKKFSFLFLPFSLLFYQHVTSISLAVEDIGINNTALSSWGWHELPNKHKTIWKASGEEGPSKKKQRISAFRSCLAFTKREYYFSKVSMILSQGIFIPPYFTNISNRKLFLICRLYAIPNRVASLSVRT